MLVPGVGIVLLLGTVGSLVLSVVILRPELFDVGWNNHAIIRYPLATQIYVAGGLLLTQSGLLLVFMFSLVIPCLACRDRFLK